MFFAKEMEKQNPSDLAIYKEGYLFYQSKEYKKALPLFQKLLFTYPFSKDLWLSYGNTLQMLQQPEEALRAFANAALLDKEDPYPHLYAAECFAALGLEEELIGALKQIGSIPHALLDETLMKRLKKLL